MKVSDPIHRGDRRVLLSLALSVAGALAACGGGGDDGGSESGGGLQPPPPPAPTPSASATCGLPDFVNTAMTRINQWRASGANCGASGNFGPTTALTWSNSLSTAAANHSLDMQANNFFSHVGTGGSTIGTRATAAGYSWGAVAENIAAGQSTVSTVVDGWIASPGHCANIMNPAYVHVGLACVPGNASNTYTTYWTMTLARPL